MAEKKNKNIQAASPLSREARGQSNHFSPSSRFPLLMVSSHTSHRETPCCDFCRTDRFLRRWVLLLRSSGQPTPVFNVFLRSRFQWWFYIRGKPLDSLFQYPSKVWFPKEIRFYVFTRQYAIAVPVSAKVIPKNLSFLFLRGNFAIAPNSEFV